MWVNFTAEEREKSPGEMDEGDGKAGAEGAGGKRKDCKLGANLALKAAAVTATFW